MKRRINPALLFERFLKDQYNSLLKLGVFEKKKCVCLIFLLKTFLGSFLKDIGIWLQIFVPILEHEFTGIESLELCVLKLFETEDGAL